MMGVRIWLDLNHIASTKLPNRFCRKELVGVESRQIYTKLGAQFRRFRPEIFCDRTNDLMVLNDLDQSIVHSTKI